MKCDFRPTPRAIRSIFASRNFRLFCLFCSVYWCFCVHIRYRLQVSRGGGEGGLSQLTYFHCLHSTRVKTIQFRFCSTISSFGCLCVCVREQLFDELIKNQSQFTKYQCMCIHSSLEISRFWKCILYSVQHFCVLLSYHLKWISFSTLITQSNINSENNCEEKERKKNKRITLRTNTMIPNPPYEQWSAHEKKNNILFHSRLHRINYFFFFFLNYNFQIKANSALSIGCSLHSRWEGESTWSAPKHSADVITYSM